jgi:hypothetical protein
MRWEDRVLARAVVDAETWARPLQVATGRALRADAAGAPAGPLDAAALPGLEDVLDAVDSGLLWSRIADRIPRPDQASRLTGASARTSRAAATAD